jgi:hypothetical protein
MAKEIVTLRQVNAQLAEKVTTLEMELESIYNGWLSDEEPVSAQHARKPDADDSNPSR